jgi:hypothetical protein
MSTERTSTDFSEAASYRLKELAGEIQARLDEIGEIIATARGQPLDAGTRVKFVPKGGETLDHPVLIEILDMPDGTTCCAVWKDADGGGATLYCPC